MFRALIWPSTPKDLPEHDLQSGVDESYRKEEETIVPWNTRGFNVSNLSGHASEFETHREIALFPADLPVQTHGIISD